MLVPNADEQPSPAPFVQCVFLFIPGALTLHENFYQSSFLAPSRPSSLVANPPVPICTMSCRLPSPRMPPIHRVQPLNARRPSQRCFPVAVIITYVPPHTTPPAKTHRYRTRAAVSALTAVSFSLPLSSYAWV